MDAPLRALERAVADGSATDDERVAFAVAKVRSGAPWALATVRRERPYKPHKSRTKTVIFVDIIQQDNAIACTQTSRAVIPALRAMLGIDPKARVAFSERAGCSTCPCSKGFEVRGHKGPPENIWVTFALGTTLPTRELTPDEQEGYVSGAMHPPAAPEGVDNTVPPR